MEIVGKQKLVFEDKSKGIPGITLLEVRAPEIAQKALPGQFVIVMVNEFGERIPLTIVKKDVSKGSITLIFQEVGFTTKLLSMLEVGESLYAIVGPLGKPTEIKNYGHVILVGGGVGVAEVLPVAVALKSAGNYITAILGARCKNLIILEEEMRSVSDKLYVATDDGSYGERGFVTDILRRVLEVCKDKEDVIEEGGDILSSPSLIYTAGPIPMMKKVAEVVQEVGYEIKVIASLCPIMVDGTGMCGCCRVTVNNQKKLACVDGPEFDALKVDWEELMRRNQIYLKQEKALLEEWQKE
jgi:ferredoxin--NADP+ reductase